MYANFRQQIQEHEKKHESEFLFDTKITQL